MPPKKRKAAELDEDSSSKPLCRYGKTCYRKNPLHTKKFSHDFPDSDDNNDSSSSEEETKVLPTPKSKRQQKIVKEKQAEAKATSIKEKKIGKWSKIGGALVLSSNQKGSDKIVGFDMDDTLIKTKSGVKFGRSSDDWVWWHAKVPEKLKKLHADGYKLVIFTNQGGIHGRGGYDSAKANMICKKIENVIEDLGVPMQAFIATTSDQYRKPSTGMWDLMINDYNDGVEPNLADCYYVGDAAGRPVGWKKGAKKDFSTSDRKFAFNANLSFATPDAYFLGEKEAKFGWGKNCVDPSKIQSSKEICDGGVASLTSSKQEMVLLIGWPGSGKSTFAKKYIVSKGYVWVNRDTLKTAAKCLKVAREALADGKSVVIDNTNPSGAARQDYIIAATEAMVPVRAFRFTASRELANHLNYFRERVTNGERRHVPDIAYNIYNKKFNEPDMSEGFSEIKKINFVLDFENERAKRLFNQWC